MSVNSTGPEISITGLPTPKPKRKSPPGSKQKASAKRRSTSSCATGCFQPSALLGRAVPDCLEDGRRRKSLSRSVAGIRVAGYAAVAHGLQTHGHRRAAAGPREGLGKSARRLHRETNTMPQWAGSCWYYLRYLDAKNPNAFVSQEAENYWMGDSESKSEVAKSGPRHDAWRGFVCRRHGTRRSSPALRPVLAQGAVRPRLRLDARTVLQARQSRADSRRRRPENVQVARQRGEPGRHPQGIRSGRVPALRNVHGPARNGKAVEHQGRRGRLSFSGPRLAFVRG